MAALFGREDPLLEPERFGRFLRQANDAEVADVRTLADGSYEVSPHKTDLGFMRSSPPLLGGEAAEPSAGNGAPATPSTAPETPSRLATLRFRRGSRAPMRSQDVPLVGMVRGDEEAPTPAPAVLAPLPDPAAAMPAPRRRGPRGGGVKRAAAASPAAVSPAVEGEVAPVAKKRTRSRPKKSG
jgi:hypothetical protein